MKESFLPFLRCPVTRTSLSLHVISKTIKKYQQQDELIIAEGILFSEQDWFYPIIDGIPRLLGESFLDYETFFLRHLPDYQQRKKLLIDRYPAFIKHILKKNQRTKQGFTQEWSLYNYETDKTWDADAEEMVQRFYRETDESSSTIKGKIIFDAGCGNGLLDLLLAQEGVFIVAMDFSLSIEKAFQKNQSPNVFFLQGDIQLPPVAFEAFDIVHCSGVLIHTNNTELSFACLVPCVKPLGKLSVWLYHPRKNFTHNLFNFIRKHTSKLPLKLQYYLYRITLFPMSYIVKRAKGNKQNTREMMIDILDWFTPEFRWEHTHAEVYSWFRKHQFRSVTITTQNDFGFNTIGLKSQSQNDIGDTKVREDAKAVEPGL